MSLSSSGTQGELLPTSSSSCQSPAFDYIDITPDGRYVAFASTAHNLVDRGGVPGDTNGACDVFVRDRVRGTTELVSVASSGAQGVGGGSGSPAISADGRFVSFVSNATNLVVGDTNLGPDIFVHDRREGATRRVSVSSDGAQATGLPVAYSAWPSISDDGRFVTFSSHADNLVAGDTNEEEDIFVHDLKTGRTVRASVDSQGAQAEGGSCVFEYEQPGVFETNVLCGGTIAPSLSRDGRFVAFSSGVGNLVPDDRNRGEDVFVHDLKTGKTVRVSVASDGTEARCSTATLCIQRTINRGGGQLSASGRHVTFNSGAQNLVPNDTNGVVGGTDSFVHDLQTGRTERVSVTSNGGELPQGGGTWNAISPSGRYVGFTACATTPEEDPLTGTCRLEVYVYDRVGGALVWASSAKNGKQSQGGTCGGLFGGAGVSSEGTAVNDRGHIAFRSCNPDLVPGDTNEVVDYFVRDFGPALGVGGFGGQATPPEEPPDDRICITPDICIPPAPALTFRDGRGDVDGAAAARGADLIGGSIAYRSVLRALYVVLELESMPRTPALAAATAGIVYGMSFEVDGSPHEVRIASSGLGPNGETTADFRVFSCPPDELMCVKVKDLEGGFGTTGERIVFSIPIDALGIEQDSTISDLRAFTAVGTFIGGPRNVLDEAAL